MGRRPLPPGVLELRGAFLRHPERRPPIEPAESSEVATLANQRLTIPEPAPVSIQDPRAARMWEQLVTALVERQLLTRDLLRPLERYVLLTAALWHAAEAGEKPPTAALSRELGSLEARLGLAAAATTGAARAPGAPPGPAAQASRFAVLKREAALDDAAWAGDPAAARERCRVETKKLLERMRRRRKPQHAPPDDQA
jgi:hypothetical protein